MVDLKKIKIQLKIHSEMMKGRKRRKCASNAHADFFWRKEGSERMKLSGFKCYVRVDGDWGWKGEIREGLSERDFRQF